MYCHHCGHQIDIDHKIGREELCSECSSYLRCCYNCELYNPVAHYECRETEIEWIEDKSFGNFCDYFKPSDKYRSPNTKRDVAKRKLDDLFKK